MSHRPIAAIAAIALLGCATGQQRHGDVLLQLRRSAPAALAGARGDGRELFAGAAELDRAALVDAVLARNPDVESARQAWRAALAGADRAAALEDPMLSYGFAPLSVADDQGVPFGQKVELAQTFPFFGKRRLAGEVALAEAEAMKGELEQVRLELSVMASNLYDDYYVAARALEINRHHAEILQQARRSAEAQYVAGRASQQDPLQAEVELENLAIERVAMESMRDATIAQLNGLLRRAPDAPLPPPVTALAVPAPALETEARELQERALASRPERAAAAARVRGGAASVELARREYYPDLAVMGSYDSMWHDPEHRWMVGLTINVPLQIGRRRAAVEEAEARRAQARSQDASLRARIAVEVATAQLRARESARVVELTETRLVPAARDQLRAALAGFTAGRNEFTAVIDAEKNQRDVELRLHTARAELWRRLAALDRAVGRPAGRAGQPDPSRDRPVEEGGRR